MTNSILEEITELRSMTVPALVERYTTAFGKPPRVKHKEWLWKRIAWKLQEQRLGGLSKVAKARLESLIAQIDIRIDRSEATTTLRDCAAGMPEAGTVLTRRWRGQEVRVTVLERGFDHEGVVYRSLSAVAKAITASHWNGKLFFGLSKRGGAI